jgi:hypothetical protein
MILPNAANAIIEQEKVVDYLLNATHPDNGGKAAFFNRLGFSPDDWVFFANALRQVALNHDCVGQIASPFGIKYIVDGLLAGKGQNEGIVRTIWISEPHLPAPRLVTAYPVGRMVVS